MDKIEENNIITEQKTKKIVWKVLLIFTLAIIFICGVVFLFNYDIAYDDNSGAGWLPPSFSVIFLYFIFSVISIVAAIILKIVYKKRVSIISLLAVAIIMPIICYKFNYNTLKKDGALYPLVDEGGIFHFIAIKDFNFDGMNDERYHILYDERRDSARYGGHFNDKIIDYIDTVAIGTGPALNASCSYDWEEKVIELLLNRDNIVYKEIIVTVAFQEASVANRTSFYLNNSELIPDEISEKSVTFIFDAETCANWQSASEVEIIEIPFEYIVMD